MAFRLLHRKATVALRLSPNSHHDKAVAVWHHEQQVGWVCRDDADSVYEKLSDSMAITGDSTISATITDIDTQQNGYIYGVANLKILRRRKLADKDSKYRITRLSQTLTFGRYEGEALEDIEDSSYIAWMVKQALISPDLAREWRRFKAEENVDEDDDDEDDEDDGVKGYRSRRCL